MSDKRKRPVMAGCRLSEAEAQRLRAAARADRVSVAEFMRSAVVDALDADEALRAAP